MNRLTWTMSRVALTIALSAPFCANATDYRLSVSGAFDAVDGSADNQLAALLGTSFTFSLAASDDSTRANYSEVESDGTVGWCFCNAPFTAAASTSAFSFTGGQPVTLYGSNDRAVSTELPVPAGTYDVFEWDGWLHNTSAGDLFGDPGTYPGVNYNFAIVLAGSPDWFDDGELPSAPLDLSKIVYGTVTVVKFIDGVQVGIVGVDPLLHVEDGQLVGDGMTVSVSLSAVPEAPGAFMLIGGLGLLGLRSRRNRRIA